MYRFILFATFFLAGCGSSVSLVDQGLENQIMHVGNGSEPQGLDPHIVTGVPEHHLLITMCEGLTISNPEGGENLPGMAESWEVSDDGKTYIFNIRKNAKWSNGDDFTAHDMVWSWKRILTASLGSQYPDMLYYIEGAEEYHTGKVTKEQIDEIRSRGYGFDITELMTLKNKKRSSLTTNEIERIQYLEESKKDVDKGIEDDIKNVKPSWDYVGVKALDDKTLKVTLKNPTPFFIGLLSHYATWPVHKETVLEYGDIDDRRGLWTRPGRFVCNGAMNLKSWELNKKIVVEKNPLYWDAESVKLNEIHFYPVSDVNTEDRMFSAGQLHLTSTVPSEMCPLWIEQGNPNLRIDPYMGTYFYRTNTTIEPLNDVRVRKALALAIDRNHITKNVNKCGAIPAYSFTPPGSNGYFPDTKIGTDLELAKSLLAEAGYPNGEGFPELEILFNTSEGHRQIALAIQQMWKKNLGINVILDNMDWKVYLSREMIGDFQISRAGWIGDYEDPNTFLDTLRPNRGNNKTGWDNKEFDSLVKLANETTNQEKRYELLREAERILIDEMPIIPIYTYVRAYQLSPDVKGFYPNYLDHHHPKTIYLERE